MFFVKGAWVERTVGVLEGEVHFLFSAFRFCAVNHLAWTVIGTGEDVVNEGRLLRLERLVCTVGCSPTVCKVEVKL